MRRLIHFFARSARVRRFFRGRSVVQLHTPQVSCRTMRLGTNYGGWTFCPEGLDKGSVVYSFGVGEDASFDVALIERFGLDVFAFDPTPRSVAWVEAQQWPPQFHFTPVGVAAHDGVATFFPPENPEHVSHTLLHQPARFDGAIRVPVKRLRTIADMLGHRRIDVLKMDIEGAEYEVIDDLARCPDLEIDQILVEFHNFLPGASTNHTHRAVDRLCASGFRIFHVAPNGKEYGFVMAANGGKR